jgi:BASS family bile acid:Na+ symporter
VASIPPVVNLLVSLLGPRFWIPAYVALLAGLFMPGDFAWVKPSVKYALGGILFFTALKIPFGEVVGGLGDRRLLGRCGWMAMAKLALLPALAWGVTRLIAPDWAAGVALVMMMPAGLSSVALTDLHRGDRVLALFLIIITSVLAPLTVPAGMALIHPGPSPDLARLADQAVYILTMLAVPFAAAQAVRLALPKVIAAGMAWWGRGSILCLVVMILVSVLANRGGWAAWPAATMLAPLAFACLASLIALGATLLLRRWLAAGAVTAFACAALYMNNGLSIVYATEFHPGDAHVILPCVLMQVPMVAMVVLWGRWAKPHDGEDAPT